MRRTSIAIVAALVSNASPAVAQEVEGPKTGTWGAEAASGPAASMLRFRSPTSAWILSLVGIYIKENSDDTSSFREDLTFLRSSARFGLRWYARPEQRVRPFSSLTAIALYEDVTFQRGWGLGFAAEMGSAYFFSSHVSLGAAADLSITHEWLDRTVFQGDKRNVRIFTAQFSGFRLLGAVYF